MGTTAWRKLLENILLDAQEEQRIANDLGVNPTTLVIWASGETNPHYEDLQHLLKTLPAHKQSLIRLLRKEFSMFALGMNSSMINRIAQAKHYAEESERIRFTHFEATFLGENDVHTTDYDNGEGHVPVASSLIGVTAATL